MIFFSNTGGTHKTRLPPDNLVGRTSFQQNIRMKAGVFLLPLVPSKGEGETTSLRSGKTPAFSIRLPFALFETISFVGVKTYGFKATMLRSTLNVVLWNVNRVQIKIAACQAKSRSINID